MAVLFPKELSISGLDYVQAGWTLLSFIVLHRFKSFMIPWIGISAVFGLFNYLITSWIFTPKHTAGINGQNRL